MPKTYFVIPTTDYPPGRLVQLGQVIKDPTLPFRRVAPPMELKDKLKPDISRIREFVATNKQSGAVSVGLKVRILSVIEGEAKAERSADATLTWEAAELETQYFEPDEDPTFLAQLQEDKEVLKWLRKARYPGKSAWVITGLKIARKPGSIKCSVYDRSSIEAQLNAVADPQGQVQVGASAGATREVATEVGGKPVGSYVFAYQLREIKVSAFTGKASIGEYRQGGRLFGDGDDSDSDELDSDSDADFDVEGDEDGGPPKPAEGLTLDPASFGSQLPAMGFEKKEVDLGSDEDSYLLVTAKTLAG